jgi:transcriptional regulator with XRE-family HTH domain
MGYIWVRTPVMTAEDLKAERERRRETQEGMAAWLGSPLSTYRKWEQGARKVPVWVSDKLVPQTVQIEKVSLTELAELDGFAREEGVTLDTLLAGLIREGLARRKKQRQTTTAKKPAHSPKPAAVPKSSTRGKKRA